MLARDIEPCVCRFTPDWANPSADQVRPPYAAAAWRMYTLLEVADILTEKPALSEMDINALEVFLEAARECAREILWSSGQGHDRRRDASAPQQ